MNLSRQEFLLIRDYIEARSGIFLGDEKMYLLENRLSDMIRRAECHNFSEFYLRIKNDPSSSHLVCMMMDAITTNETSWFRDPRSFHVLKEIIFPELYENMQNGGPAGINIWSAACSTGQEPYSAAIAALEFFLARGGEKACRQNIRILATDISAAAIETAETGQYDHNAMNRGLPREYMDRYFRKTDHGRWGVRDFVRDMVTFKQHNLKIPVIWNAPFQVVFLRNVIIYFSERFKDQLFCQMVKRMAPSAYLLLGTGEMPRSEYDVFDTVTYQGYSFYRLKNS